MQRFIYRSECQPIYEEWLDTLPSSAGAAMRLYLPEFADCYRIVGDGGGHYFFLEVVEPFNDLPVTSTLLHGRYSSAPGMLVLGVPLAELLTCDCGTLQFLYQRGGVERTHLHVPSMSARFSLPEPLRYRLRFSPGSRNSDTDYSVAETCEQIDRSFVRPPTSELKCNKSNRQQFYEEWIDTLPSAVAAALRHSLPTVADCYRIAGDREGHYFLDQVIEPTGDFPVTCNLLHGRNSSDPGGFVTGVPVAEVLPCDCGTLEFPLTYAGGLREHSDAPSNIWTRYDLTGPLRARRRLQPNERT